MNIEEIAKEIAVKFYVTHNDIFSIKRCRNIVKARMVLYKLMYMFGYSIHQIANILNKDHTTIIHGLRRVDEDEKLSLISKELYEKHYEPCERFNSKDIKKVFMYVIQDFLNKGKSLYDVSEELGISLNMVNKYAPFVLKCKKKVPDYKNGGFKIIYEV